MSASFREIWLICKIPQFILGLFCIYYHFVGIRYFQEPVIHNMIYCGVFCGFTVLTVLGIFAILQDLETSIFNEAIYNSIAFLCYVIASLLTMSNVEDDEHLLTLTDNAEAKHTFFINCKKQSAVALGAAIAHMVSCTFAFDALLIREKRQDTKTFRYADLTDVNPRDPIKLYFFSRNLHKCLALNSRTFRNIARIPHPEDEEIIEMEKKILELKTQKRRLSLIRKRKIAEQEKIHKEIRDLKRSNKKKMADIKKQQKAEKKASQLKNEVNVSQPSQAAITLVAEIEVLNKEVANITEDIDPGDLDDFVNKEGSSDSDDSLPTEEEDSVVFDIDENNEIDEKKRRRSRAKSVNFRKSIAKKHDKDKDDHEHEDKDDHEHEDKDDHEHEDKDDHEHEDKDKAKDEDNDNAK